MHQVAAQPFLSHFPQTNQACNLAIEQGKTAGIVIGIYHPKLFEGKFIIHAWGKRRLTPSQEPMLASTVFDLASLTKILFTSCLVFHAVKEKKLKLDEPIIHTITPQDLLAHVSGLPAHAKFYHQIENDLGPPLWKKALIQRQKKMQTLVQELLPKAHPGQHYEYSDIGFLALGFFLQKLFDKPLETLAAELFSSIQCRLHFAPILQSTESLVLQNLNIAATEDCPWRRCVLQGQVHDQNTWAMGGIAPHAGLFGTAQDVLQWSKYFFETLLPDPTFAPFLERPPILKAAHTWGGFSFPSATPPSCSYAFSKASVGHLGFTGTSLWMDVEAKLSVCLLTNRMQAPEGTLENIKILRPLIHEKIRIDLQGQVPRYDV
jgi:CubicO group peptidase (beta-lactamase class C family)